MIQIRMLSLPPGESLVTVGHSFLLLDNFTIIYCLHVMAHNENSQYKEVRVKPTTD